VTTQGRQGKQTKTVNNVANKYLLYYNYARALTITTGCNELEDHSKVSNYLISMNN